MSHYITTHRKIVFWFNRLNQTLFDIEVPLPEEIHIKRLSGYLGWAECDYNEITGEINYMELTLHDKFSNLNEFINVLGHEMVHFYQFQRGDSGNHNKLFYSFREIFEENGLKLTRLFPN